jgi:hypothetical protein
MKKVVLFLYLIIICSVKVFSQAVTDNGLRNHTAAIQAMREFKPIEKVYLQTDKPYYATADTLRFKVYILNADYLTPSNHSGILYVQLDDQTGKSTKRIMVPVTQGLAWGDIALDPKDIPEGSYTLRAYTNWMQNFGEDYVYKQNINISSTASGATLVKANFKQQQNKVEATLQFATLDGKLQVLRDMELKVMAGRKNLSKDKVTTTIDGAVQVNFDIPENTSIKDLSIKARDVSKANPGTAELTIPVTIKRQEDTDIQFMPEGGNLVAGIPTKVGFKAIGEDGKGINITGKILNSKGQEVAQINTAHAGMGSFTFTPNANENYIAKFNGINKSYPLPIVNANGTVLKITAKDDSLQLTLVGNQQTNATYYLIGQSRGVVCYAATINLNNGQPISKVIAKKVFPTGIARFTLINVNHQPVNERQVFINHNDNLHISIKPGKSTYTIRDSVALTIEVKDKDGKPIQGNFSLAVTDDSQVKADTLSNNMISNLLLTSDLKGNIEDPNYYFNNNSAKQNELDNLMLTQGWVGYNWQEVFHPTPIAYYPETEFAINGTVTNAFGKPIAKSNIVLVANNPLLFKDTLTNKEGQFSFKGLFPVDTALFKLQARNKNNKANNVKIEVDNKKYPEFKAISITPWYVNGDSIQLNNSASKAAQLKAIANYNGEGQMLKEVTIKDKRIIKGSKNLNGPGEADQIIDEEELVKANKMTLNDLLHQKIIGITERGRWSPLVNAPTVPMTWVLNYKKLHFVFDGMDLEYFYPNQTLEQRYQTIKIYLDYFTAEDITGIELMWNSKYDTNYGIQYLPPTKFGGEPQYQVDAWLEITTRSKQGPFMQVVPGTYLYKTLPFTLPKQFYSPKYTVKNKAIAMGTDMRSTLHWEPNVITNAEGKAIVSFFTADKLANYTIIVEGTDLDGQIGYGRQRLISK